MIFLSECSGEVDIWMIVRWRGYVLAGDWHPAMVDLLLTYGKRQLYAYCHYSNWPAHLYRLIKFFFSLFRASSKIESDRTVRSVTFWVHFHKITNLCIMHTCLVLIGFFVL